MFSEIELTVGLAVGFVTGIVLVTLVARFKSRENEDLKISELENLNYEKEVAPFIKIHESLLEGTTEPKFSDSVNHLKSKIENFKLRNQFYKD